MDTSAYPAHPLIGNMPDRLKRPGQTQDIVAVAGFQICERFFKCSTVLIYPDSEIDGDIFKRSRIFTLDIYGTRAMTDITL
jgi:hypothetical protein